MSAIEYINSATLTADNTTGATFTSIPATYTDLFVTFNGKYSFNHLSIFVRLNADSTTTYSNTWLLGEVTTGTASSRESNVTAARMFAGNYGALADEQFCWRLDVLSYSNSSVNKTMLAQGGAANAVNVQVGLWRNTAVVNSLTLFVAGVQTFRAGSTFTLWGVK